MSVTRDQILEACAVLRQAQDEGEVLALVVLTVEDLDSRQTTSAFDGDALEMRMLDTGLRGLWEWSRPGCECASHEDDDRCEVKA